MTFKQITDSFNKRFSDLRGSLYDYKYKFNHFDPDFDSVELRREYASFVCQSYRDLVALSADIHTFFRFASKESEKDVLWKLHVDVDDYCDKVFDFVDYLRSFYHWDY